MAKNTRGITLSNTISNSGLTFAVAPKSIETELKKATKTNNSGDSLVGLHAIESNPAGCALFTYWLAVLTVLGGFTPARNSMSIKTIRSLFKSGSVISHHSKNGNLEKVDSNSIRLTITGWNYFTGRLNGSTHGQRVIQTELDSMVESIKHGGPGFRAI